MALTREKKQQVVSEISQLLADSKLTVIAKYQGTPVKAMQRLRHDAAKDGTALHVVKNRLFKRVLEGSAAHKDIDTTNLIGQLMYAFNADDEVAPARVLAEFAKTNPQIEFISAITADGQLLDTASVQNLAVLPTKNVLRAQLIGTISAPISGMVNVLAGNVRGILNALNARAESLEA